MAFHKENDGAHYVEEGQGRLPHLLYFQSKGGWPVFEMVQSWAEAYQTREAFAAKGITVQIFHWIVFDDGDNPYTRRATLPPPPPDTKAKDEK